MRSRESPSVARLPWKLRQAGGSYREIVRHLGIDVHTAYADVGAELAALREKTVESAAASRMAEAGVPLPEIRDTLGHTTTTQTSTYLGTTARSLVSAIERTEQHQQQLAEMQQQAEAQQAQAQLAHEGAGVRPPGSDRIQ